MRDDLKRFSLAQIDAVDWLQGLPDSSVDLLVTDPPYESLEKHRAVGTTTRLKHSKSSSNDWFRIFPNQRFPELLRQAYRVLRRNSHFYLFCDHETFFVVKPLAEMAGFRFWKPLVWDKQMIGMGYHYRARYEFILFFEKGRRRLVDLGIPDVLSSKRIVNGYPAEKPVPLLEILVAQSSVAGDVVVDPFCGSGTTLSAAVSQGRNAMGADISPVAVERSLARLNVLNAVRATEEELLLSRRL